MRSGSGKTLEGGNDANFSRFCNIALKTLTPVMVIGLAWLNGAAAHGQGLVVPKGVPPSGEKLFGQQCGACHSTIAGEARVGPSLAGIMGRTAGKSPGFTYSRTLRASQIRWNEKTLNLWLADSNAEIPGSIMNYRQSDPAKRLAIIAYLKKLSAK